MTGKLEPLAWIGPEALRRAEAGLPPGTRCLLILYRDEPGNKIGSWVDGSGSEEEALMLLKAAIVGIQQRRKTPTLS